MSPEDRFDTYKKLNNRIEELTTARDQARAWIQEADSAIEVLTSLRDILTRVESELLVEEARGGFTL